MATPPRSSQPHQSSSSRKKGVSSSSRRNGVPLSSHKDPPSPSPSHSTGKSTQLSYETNVLPPPLVTRETPRSRRRPISPDPSPQSSRRSNSLPSTPSPMRTPRPISPARTPRPVSPGPSSDGPDLSSEEREPWPLLPEDEFFPPQMYSDPGPDDLNLETLLLSNHECGRPCGLSWIQDLSPLAYMIKLDGVSPGTKPIAHQPRYHKAGPQGRWYAVLRGKSVGVYNNW